uniref:Uncharacterized protein n=1 Tax=Macaca fascicularis TaxID=9541 RepID=A0A7N9CSE5_MACFA
MMHLDLSWNNRIFFFFLLFPPFLLPSLPSLFPFFFDRRDSAQIIKITMIQAGCGGSRLYSQHFGRPRWANHLRSGVGDQPGQHGETPSLLKTQKLAGHGGMRL